MTRWDRTPTLTHYDDAPPSVREELRELADLIVWSAFFGLFALTVFVVANMLLHGAP